jgi:hypothetical protein
MSSNILSIAGRSWPQLPFAEWQDTRLTLHLWTQIIGKIRLSLTPWVNHSWHTTLYLTARGLTTSPIPYGDRSFQIDFDFVDHTLLISEAGGESRTVQLKPRSVADFYAAVMSALAELRITVTINKLPNELPDVIAFDQDETHRSYDPKPVHRFWQILGASNEVFGQFRTAFVGKVSPVHFFWGSFDLAVTRFSGRRAPLHPGGVVNLPDTVAREAYSHEVSSAGFWPGDAATPYPAYYSYAYPEPAGFRTAKLAPKEAAFNTALSEFILPYDEVRKASNPQAALMEFLESTYRAAADAAHWDRPALECALGIPGVPRQI